MKPTARILALQKQFFNQYKKNKEEWVDRYENEAEQRMYGAAFTRAKAASMKEQKQRIREMVKHVLSTPVASKKEENPIDTVTVDIPLMIRLLEYAREDAKTDMDLHKVAENLIQLSKAGRTLDMTDYNSIIEPDSEA